MKTFYAVFHQYGNLDFTWAYISSTCLNIAAIKIKYFGQIDKLTENFNFFKFANFIQSRTVSAKNIINYHENIDFRFSDRDEGVVVEHLLLILADDDTIDRSTV